MKELEAVEECPACQLNKVFSRVDFQVPLGQYRMVDVIKCRDCGSLFKSHFLSGGAIAEHYTGDDYYSFNQYSVNSEGVRSRISRISARCSPTSVLDVGCGQGIMVKGYLDAGWDAFGTDPYLVEDKIPPSLAGRLLQLDIAETALPRKDFDAVTLWYVLEHLVSPLELLNAIAGHMRRGGILIALVPWAESLAARLYQGHWSELVLAEHVVAYSRRGLEVLFENAGLAGRGYRFAGRPFPLGKVSHSLEAQGFSQPRKSISGDAERLAETHRASRLPSTNAERQSKGRFGLKNGLRGGIDLLRVGDYIEVYGTRI